MENNEEKTIICETCRFYDQKGVEKHGVCRRNAPEMNSPCKDCKLIWPPVNYNDWCGEHEFTE